MKKGKVNVRALPVFARLQALFSGQGEVEYEPAGREGSGWTLLGQLNDVTARLIYSALMEYQEKIRKLGDAHVEEDVSNSRGRNPDCTRHDEKIRRLEADREIFRDLFHEALYYFFSDAVPLLVRPGWYVWGDTEQIRRRSDRWQSLWWQEHSNHPSRTFWTELGQALLTDTATGLRLDSVTLNPIAAREQVLGQVTQPALLATRALHARVRQALDEITQQKRLADAALKANRSSDSVQAYEELETILTQRSLLVQRIFWAGVREKVAGCADHWRPHLREGWKVVETV